MRRFLFILCVLTVTLMLGCGGKDGQNANTGDEEAVPVSVAKVSVRLMTLELESTGDVRAFADASVISEVAGTIEELLVEKGQEVNAGDVIVVVEHAEASASLREAEAALKAARAQVLQAEATLRNLEIEFNRFTSLSEDGVASAQMLDEVSAGREVAAAAKEMAIAQVAQAEAAIEQASVFLANHTIRAPISGVITERYVDLGDKNNPESPIVTIAQTDRLKVDCNFPERDLSLLEVGQSAHLKTDAYPDEKFPAEVVIISPAIDPMTRTVAVELQLPNSDGRLRPGMFVWAIVLGDEFEALAAPDDSLTRIPGTAKEFVYVIESGIAKRVDVKAGRGSEGWTQVSGELKPGDLVVIQGQSNLRSGKRVKIDSDT